MGMLRGLVASILELGIVEGLSLSENQERGLGAASAFFPFAGPSAGVGRRVSPIRGDGALRYRELRVLRSGRYVGLTVQRSFGG